ncbi:MAG TPA: glycosyltransferase [Chitinophagaceae bacterium]|nr:glycosyltransferase [Chitinophagaceae bacterium]
MKKIFFTVTNDLTYDQRMKRICSTLSENGYQVCLIGRRLRTSVTLSKEKYFQKRIRCWFNKGKLFYTEFNIRLFFYLLFKKIDAICAIDLDTILPCLTISRLKKITRIYDAHELFTEMKEVITRPGIHKFWSGVEKKAVPKFELGYTVSNGLSNEFKRRYGVRYETIRNMPVLKEFDTGITRERFILYQGAVNEARGFEFLIPAMKKIDCSLVICGSGNFTEQLHQLIKENKVEGKVDCRGMVSPDELWKISQQAWIGIHVPEAEGLNQYLALPNKFFDYIDAGLPQVTVGYPEYKKINDEWDIALLIEKPDAEIIAETVNHLLQNDVLHQKLMQNCFKARKILNWQEEEKKLLSFYQKVFNP